MKKTTARIKNITHTHTGDTEKVHSHSHEADTGHKHSHQNTKAVLNRLSRAAGHLDSVKRMIEDGKDCSEVLIQLSAVIAALTVPVRLYLKTIFRIAL